MRDKKIIDAEFEVISGPQPTRRKTNPLLVFWFIKMAVVAVAIVAVVVSNPPSHQQPDRPAASPLR
jgi:hypothetical protein